jgi:hypothetical protein
VLGRDLPTTDDNPYFYSVPIAPIDCSNIPALDCNTQRRMKLHKWVGQGTVQITSCETVRKHPLLGDLLFNLKGALTVCARRSKSNCVRV